MGQKHKRFREFRTPFPLCDIRENPRSYVRAYPAADGAICSKNRKIVPYHGAGPNTRNGARLRSPSLIMAPGFSRFHRRLPLLLVTTKHQLRSADTRGTGVVFGKITTISTPKMDDRGVPSYALRMNHIINRQLSRDLLVVSGVHGVKPTVS